MVNSPQTRYAATELGRIAFQQVGDGPIDVVVLPPLHVCVDTLWDEPGTVRFLERMSTFCRHTWFDSRGRGASDPLPVPGARLAEDMADDIIALLDVLGLDRVAVLDLGYGAPALLLAAGHPERVSALALFHPLARVRQALDYPEGWTNEYVEEFLTLADATWGTEASTPFAALSAVSDPVFVRWLARAERSSCSPAEAVRRLRAIVELDIRSVLPIVTVPTLVITPGDHAMAPFSRYVARHISRAQHLDLGRQDFFFSTGDSGPILGAVEEFFTGRLATPDVDRVLATVMFTDVVNSTQQAARLGDRRWRDLLAAHDKVVRGELQRHRGREIKSTGDGFLAVFDGPGRAIRAARAITDSVRDLGVHVRAGLHAGEIELIDNDVGGIAVHIGQRVSGMARPDEVLVSSTVRDLVVGSGIEFQDRGEHVLKGLPGSWHLFSVTA